MTTQKNITRNTYLRLIEKKINRNNKPIDNVLKLPFINENISKKMQNIIRGTTLDINHRIIFNTQKPLGMILQKEKGICICENRNMCLKKNSVQNNMYTM